MKSGYIIFFSSVLMFYAIGSGAQIAGTRFVDEESFPTGWTKPEVVVNNGTVAVTPSVPSDFKKTDLGASLTVRSADITKYENIPIIERLDMTDCQQLKNEFMFTKIADAQTPSGVEIRAKAVVGGKSFDLVFYPDDIIYLKAVPYRIKDVRRAYEPEKDETDKVKKKDDVKKEVKAEEEQKEAVILLPEKGKDTLVAELDKNILPASYKIRFTDKYSKKSFFAPCPGVMKVQDVDGKVREVFNLAGIENNILIVKDSGGKVYKFARTKAK